MILAQVSPDLVGQVVGMDIRNAGQSTPFLRAGTVLKPVHIYSLLRLGFRQIYVHDPFLPDMEIRPVIDPQTRESARAAVESTMIRLAEGRGRMADLTPVRESVRKIIDDLTSVRETSFNLSVLRQANDYTFVHSVNVATIALALGQKLGMSQAELEYLGTGGLLHDVGKARLPESILNKPGPLDEMEWAEMKRHCEYGYDWLRQYFHSIPYPSALCALEHHERLDGSGYPRGLSGDEIHYISRIVAVADVYDAMTADRVYRSGCSTPTALAHLSEEAGKRLDEDVVIALLDTAAHYPEGSVVRLADGLVGRVVRQTANPASPIVAVVATSELIPIPSPEPYLVEARGKQHVVEVLSGYPVELLRRAGLLKEDAI